MADLITTPIRVTIKSPDGSVPLGAAVTADLVSLLGFPTIGVDQGLVVPNRVSVAANSAGTAIINLWPNSRGTVDTQYRLTLVQGTKKYTTLLISVPEVSEGVVIDLEDVVVLPSPTPIDYSAILVARLAALEAEVELLRNGVIIPDLPSNTVLDENNQAIIDIDGAYVIF